MRNSYRQISRPPFVLIASIILAVAVGIVHFPFSPLLISIVCAFAGCAAIEFARNIARNERWWIAYVAVLPWIVIVLLPWSYYASEGSWTILGHRIDTGLPLTWRMHVVALLGLTFGTLVGLAVRLPRLKANCTSSGPLHLRERRLNVTMGGLLAVYLMSFVLADRPLAALWKLSGTVAYGRDVDSATGLLFLDLSLVTATLTLVVYAASRRVLHRSPTCNELGWLAVYAALSLGSGIRGRFFLLALGWGIVQFIPEFTGILRQRPRRIIALLGGACAFVVVVQAAGIIADQRVRLDTTDDSAVRRAIESTEVLGSSEALLSSNVEFGELAGSSYSGLPGLFIPARLSGVPKQGPSADELMRDRLALHAGYSAPLWIEPALNYRGPGALTFSFLYAFLTVLWLRWMRQRGARFAVAATAVGPVWVLVSYVALSRLTLFQALVATTATIIGVRLGSRTVKWRSTSWECLKGACSVHRNQ